MGFNGAFALCAHIISAGCTATVVDVCPVVLVAQNRLRKSRAGQQPPTRGSLNVSMIETVKIPALSSFSNEGCAWWGSDACVNPEMKALWRKVDKARLLDHSFALATPGAPGSTSDWDAHKESFVASFNSGSLPLHFLHIGGWPESVQSLHVYPGLTRIAQMLPTLRGAHIFG